jgi:hypothetical protein
MILSSEGREGCVTANIIHTIQMKKSNSFTEVYEALESFDSSHSSVPRNPPPSPWELVCSWNEEDEIRFVEHEDKIRFAKHEDKDHHSHSHRHFHVPTRQKQKGRRVPGPVYLIPALVVAW